MKNKQFRGIMPALPTAIDPDSRFKSREAEAMIRHLLASPIRGFYINGATGEGPILPEAARKENAELAVALVKGRGVVINQVAAPDTQSAIELARHAGRIGCDAVSSVVPNFFFKYTTDRVCDYFSRLADASGLPVLVYANNLLDGDAYSFMEKAMRVEGVIGLKYTIYDYYQMQRICELNGGDINVINGPDEMLLCGLAMGADGGIGSTYNLMPEWFCDLYDAMENGRLREAQDLQRKINHVITLLKKYNCLSSVKTYFRFLGIDIGDVAYPGTVLTAEESAALEAGLRALGVPSLCR